MKRCTLRKILKRSLQSRGDLKNDYVSFKYLNYSVTYFKAQSIALQLPLDFNIDASKRNKNWN